MISFDEARAIVAAQQGWDPAQWGWENHEVYVMAYDYGEEPAPLEEPELLVDKRTGELRRVHCSAGQPPAPDLRPIGARPRAYRPRWPE